MEQISNRCSGIQQHTEYIIYIENMNVTEKKYQKDRDISSETLCPNTNPYIELPHWKYVFPFFPKSPTIVFD